MRNNVMEVREEGGRASKVCCVSVRLLFSAIILKQLRMLWSLLTKLNMLGFCLPEIALDGA